MPFFVVCYMNDAIYLQRPRCGASAVKLKRSVVGNKSLWHVNEVGGNGNALAALVLGWFIESCSVAGLRDPLMMEPPRRALHRAGCVRSPLCNRRAWQASTRTHTHIHGGDKVPKAHDPDSQGSEEVDHLQDSQKLSKCLAFFLQLCLWTLWCPKMVGGDYDLDPRGLGGRLRGSIKLFQNISLSKIFCCIHRYQTC